MHFDGTIHLGDVLMLGSMIGGAFAVWGRFSAIETKVNLLMDWFQGKVYQGERRASGERRGYR